ncbi:MAG TPA: DUF1552 domain-containing protein [Polyangiaceae bacterium]
MTKTVRFGRRRALVGLGGITVALPWLEKLGGVAHAQSPRSGPRRILVMAYEMGVPLGQWRPSAVGATFDLPYVSAPLEAMKDRCLFVTSIDNSVLGTGGNAFVFGHPAKREAALTGTLTTGAFAPGNTNQVGEVRADATTDGGANGPSVEHVIGEHLRAGQPLPSVNVGVDGNAGLSTWGGPPPTSPSNFFFEGAGNAITLDLHPSALYARLFSDIEAPDASQEALRAMRARKKSVLDAVRDGFRDLSQGLGSEDRRRLEEHAERIRQIELDLPTGSACSAPSGIPTSDDYTRYRMDQLAPLQRRILIHAMACNLAPVGRFEFTNQQNPRFGIAALDTALDEAGTGYDWHAMVHGDPLPGTTAYLRPGRGDDQTYSPLLLDGYRFFVREFAALLAELAELPDGPEQTLLDTSLVVLASDLGEGLGHGHMKMGYVLAGNLGDATTGHFDAGPSQAFQVGGSYYYSDSRFNVNQLLNSMLDMAGVTAEGGAPASIGLGGYLEQSGAPRRIDDLFV